MSQSSRQVWIKLASGSVKGPFPSTQVSAAWKAGKVPLDATLGLSADGPWRPVASCFPAAAVSGGAAAAPQAPASGGARSVAGAAPPSPPAPATPSPAPAAERPAGLGPTPDGLMGVAKHAWQLLRSRYVAVMFPTVLVGLLLVVLLNGADIVGQFVDLPQGGGFALGFLVFTPLSLMLLAGLGLMVLGRVERGPLAAWSTLFSWASSLKVAYPLALVGGISDIAGHVIGAALKGGNRGEQSFVQDAIVELLSELPWLLFVLAIMLLVGAVRGRFGFMSSIRTSVDSVMANRGASLVSLLVGAAAAVVAGLLGIGLLIGGIALGVRMGLGPLVSVMIGLELAVIPALLTAVPFMLVTLGIACRNQLDRPQA